jgi:hypothetical protein
VNRRALVAFVIFALLFLSLGLAAVGVGVLKNSGPDPLASGTPLPVVVVSPRPGEVAPSVLPGPLVSYLAPPGPVLVPAPTLVPGPTVYVVSPAPGSTRTVTVTASPSRRPTARPTPSPTCTLPTPLGCARRPVVPLGASSRTSGPPAWLCLLWRAYGC